MLADVIKIIQYPVEIKQISINFNTYDIRISLRFHNDFRISSKRFKFLNDFSILIINTNY